MDINRYSRQTVYKNIGRAGQERLFASRAAILGAGALGSVAAGELARAGVGFIRIVDRDYVELSNLQRQALYTEEDVRRKVPKAEAAVSHLREINSEVTTEAVIADINSSNIARLCADCDVVIDGADNIELRQLINEERVWEKKPWVYGGAIRSGGAVMNIVPGETACFRCLYPEDAGRLPGCSTEGVLNMVTAVIASIEAAEAVKLLLGVPEIRKNLLYIDLWQNTFDAVEVEKNPCCPVCGQGKFGLLDKSPETSTTVLCGRNAVQVAPPARSLDLAALAEKLQKTGDAGLSRFMLSFSDSSVKFELFPDGRAIILDTSDENRARSIYSEYIGF
jgi:adenylyltransferase/sulfurtransferase